MAGFWQMTNRASAGNASATQSAPAGSASGGQQTRLRALAAMTATAAATVQVLDGATVIFQIDMPVANTQLQLPNLDLRASPGNNLVVQTTANSGIADVNAQGDFVSQGYPAYGP